MNNKKELSYKDLKMVCNRDMFHFETTQDLESVNDGIGQERGIKALQFGLQVDVKDITYILKDQVELEKQCIQKTI